MGHTGRCWLPFLFTLVYELYAYNDSTVLQGTGLAQKTAQTSYEGADSFACIHYWGGNRSHSSRACDPISGPTPQSLLPTSSRSAFAGRDDDRYTGGKLVLLVRAVHQEGCQVLWGVWCQGRRQVYLQCCADSMGQRTLEQHSALARPGSSPFPAWTQSVATRQKGQSDGHREQGQRQGQGQDQKQAEGQVGRCARCQSSPTASGSTCHCGAQRCGINARCAISSTEQARSPDGGIAGVRQCPAARGGFPAWRGGGRPHQGHLQAGSQGHFRADQCEAGNRSYTGCTRSFLDSWQGYTNQLAETLEAQLAQQSKTLEEFDQLEQKWMQQHSEATDAIGKLSGTHAKPESDPDTDMIKKSEQSGTIDKDPWFSESTWQQQQQQQRQDALLQTLQTVKRNAEKLAESSTRDTSRTPRRRDAEALAQEIAAVQDKDAGLPDKAPA